MVYALAGSAPGHVILLPPIHIPQAPLTLCSHPYSDGLSQTQPGSCRMGTARGLAASASRGARSGECSGL